MSVVQLNVSSREEKNLLSCRQIRTTETHPQSHCLCSAWSEAPALHRPMTGKHTIRMHEDVEEQTCNIKHNELISQSRVSENSESVHPEMRKTPGFPFHKAASVKPEKEE